MLTPQGVAEALLATAFLGQKLEEYEVLRREIEALKGEVGSGEPGVELSPHKVLIES